MSRWDLFTSSYDTVSKRMGYIRSDHAYIHEGLGYGFNDTSEFANGETKYFILTTQLISIYTLKIYKLLIAELYCGKVQQ